jgi:hypothetical protein
LIITTVVSVWPGAPWPVFGTTGTLAGLSVFSNRRGWPKG